MKTKIDWNEIEKKTDFNVIKAKFTEASAAGGLNRRRSAGDLLDKVKDEMLDGRARGASYASIAAFLNDHGLPVSEPTVREYLRKLEGGKKTSRKPSKEKKPKSTTDKQETKAIAPVEAQQPPLISPPPAPPTLERSRGPRIADPSKF